MIYTLLFTLLCPLLMWALFYFLYNKLAGDTKKFLSVWIIGAVLDIYVNLTWGTLMFLQLPNINRGFLSARMDDLICNGEGWRNQLAVNIVGRFLEPYDLSIPKQHKTYGKFSRHK